MRKLCKESCKRLVIDVGNLLILPKNNLAKLKDPSQTFEKAQNKYSERMPGPGISWFYYILRGSIEFLLCAEEIKTAYKY